MKMKYPQLITAAFVCALAAASTHAQTEPTLQTTRETRIGKIELDKGFPSKATVTMLYDGRKMG